MRLFITATLAAMLASTASAQEAKYVLTGDNTKITWTGTKVGGKHDGGFKNVGGVATMSATTGLRLNVEIDTGSLFADDPKLTAHLKSPDFFSVKDHPRAKFVSTKIDKTASGFTVNGDLTLLGKTKAISFPAQITAGDTLGIQAAFTISRSDFGMNYGKGIVNDTVSLKVAVNARK
ncbi:MAG TPA: YceI family protein [Gemmataceae bacterium]|jgi:polyisoprenoid-binding protein YceI|nr:YceI family protein [Gemmataceae bacterium]